MTAAVEAPTATPWLDADGRMVPGVYDGMPEEVYHADPVPGGSLSASGGKLLTDPGCPAKYRYAADNPQPYKRVFEFGHAAHREVLGVGADVVVIDADNYKTKKAQTDRDDARAAGLTPLLPAEWQVVKDMAAALRATPLAAQALAPQSGLVEASAFWVDEASGITRRCRFDLLRHRQAGRRRVVVDYKTCVNADEEALQKAFVNHGYHRSAAWYLDAVRDLNLHGDLEPVFLFVCQEKTAPYLVNVVQPDPNAVRIGGIDNRRAIRLFADCQRTGHWPGYVGADPNWLSLPTWIENREEYKQ